jgi:hypothetical protein
VVDTAWLAAHCNLKSGVFLAFGDLRRFNPMRACQNEMSTAAKAIVVGLRARSALRSGVVTRAGQNKIDNKDIDCCTKQQDEGREFQQRAPGWHNPARA